MIKSRMVNNKIIFLSRAISLLKNRYPFLHQKQIQHAPTDPYGAYLYMYNIYVCNTHIQIVKNHK